MRTLRSRVSGDATAVLALKVLHAALLFLTSAVVSRGLGPEGRGLYYTPLLIATTTIALCHVGMDQANVYLFGSRKVPLARLIGQSGMVALAGGITGGFAIIALSRAQVPFFAGVPAWMAVGSAILVPFGVHAILATGLLTLQGRVATPLLVNITVAIVQLTALGLLALAGRFTPGVVFVLASTAIVTTTAVLGLSLSASGPLLAWDAPLLKESLAHSIVLHVGMALLFLHLRVDMFLVKWMLGTAALGLYSLAVVLAESVMLIADSLSTALMPRQMTGALSEAASTALRGVRAVAVIGLPLVILWLLLGPVIIGLAFGSSFAPIYVPLLVLLPGIVLLGMQRVCGPAVLRAGRPWVLTSVQAAGFTSNLLLNLWWIPIWGLVGAAAASTLSYGLMALAVMVWTGRLAGESLAAALPRVDDVLRVVDEVKRLLKYAQSALTVERQHV